MRFTSIALILALLSVGLLTPAQAFTYTADESPSTAEQKTATSDSDVALMELTLTTKDANGEEIFTDDAISLPFRPGATTEWDRYDASKLFPRGDTWAAMAFEGTKAGEDVLKAQESRPHSDSVQVVDVKIVQKNMPAAAYTISIETWYSVPSDWSLRLRVQTLDQTFIIDDANDTITFKLDQSSQSSQKSSSDTTQVSLAGEVGPSNSNLPVEMVSFSAQAKQEQAVLEWETVSETNNTGFGVQHRQAKGFGTSAQWSKIGFVNGQGTTNQPHSYRFRSTSLSPGTHAFRLKQIDQDGTAHFSETVTLVRKPSGPVELTTAPNPFAEQVTVTLTPRSSQSVSIQLVDMLGRVVKKVGPIDVSADVQTQLQLAGNRLSSGSYLLRVDGETFTETERVARVR